MVISAYVLSGVSLLMSLLLFIHVQAPAGFLILLPKLTAGALSLVWMIAGLFGLILGVLGGLPLAASAGCIGMAIMGWYLWRVTKDTQGFSTAFGPEWKQYCSTKSPLGRMPLT